MRRERIASVVTALALVLAAVGGGLGPLSATQTASAEWVDCSFSDPLTGAAYNTIIGADSGCRWESGTSTDYQNLTKTNSYSSALSLKDSQSSYTTTVSNFQENTRSIAYQKSKIAVVRALENGSGTAVMSNEANVSQRDYYARIQIQLLEDWNSKAEQVRYLRNTSLDVIPTDDPGVNGSWSANATYDVEQAELVNGSTHPVYTLNTEASGGTARPLNPAGSDTVNGSTFYKPYDIDIAAIDPSTGDHTPILDAGAYNQIWTDAENQSVQVADNLWQYVQGVESQYDAGELNATTLYQNDPSLLASEATTSYNSTGYYGYASAQLAAIGYSGDLNQSHVVEVGGANYTGTLFFSGEDGKTFQTGETYDFANVSGGVYMAVSDGPNNVSGIVRLDDRGSSFRILEATNTQTGEAVNSTTPQKYVYESANASNLQQEIDRLEELREFYQEQASSGGVGINLGTEDKAIIGVIGAVVLVLALRD